MSRRMILHAFCSVCEAEGKEEVEGQMFSISINGESAELEVCEKHGTAIVLAQELIEKFGAKVMGKARQTTASTKVPCHLCPATLSNRQSLSAHLRKAHQTGIRKEQEAGRIE